MDCACLIDDQVEMLKPSATRGKGLGTSRLIGGYTSCGVPRVDPMEAFYKQKAKDDAKAAAAARKAAGGGKKGGKGKGKGKGKKKKKKK